MNKVIFPILFLGGAIVASCYSSEEGLQAYQSDLFIAPVSESKLYHDQGMSSKNPFHQAFYAQVQKQRDELLSDPEQLKNLKKFRDLCIKKTQKQGITLEKFTYHSCRLVDTYRSLLEYSMAYNCSVMLLKVAGEYPTAFSDEDTRLLNRVIKEYSIIHDFYV